MMKSKLRATAGWSRLFVVAVLGMGWLLWQTTAVSFAAYAMPTQASPEQGEVVRGAPRRVVITFSEAMLPTESEIRVFDANGARVDLQNCGIDVSDPWRTTMVVNLRPDLPVGSYTVRWTTVSIESNETLSGQYQFEVAPSILQFVLLALAIGVGVTAVTGGWVGFGITYRRLRRLELAYQELMESRS